MRSSVYQKPNGKRMSFFHSIEKQKPSVQKHTKVYLHNKQTTVPRHIEISDNLVKAIKKTIEYRWLAIYI